MIDLSIILPCYNEGATVSRLVDGYRAAVAGRKRVELVLVDNGSTDNTAEQLQVEREKENPFFVKLVTVPRNRGYGHGIMTGLKSASGEHLAWSHADLQCPPEDVIRLYDAVMSRPDPKRCFGKGYRVNERGGAGLFTGLHTFFSRLILGCLLEEINAQPKLFHRSFLKTFIFPPTGYELDVFAYYKAVLQGFDIVLVEVHFLERKSGQSKWAYSIYSRICFMLRNFVYLMKLRLKRNRI